MKYAIYFIIIFIFCMTLNASMINDVVTIRHGYPTFEQTWDDAEVVTVIAGTTDTILYGNGYYTVNFEADQILIDFTQPGGWTATSFNGLVVTGIDIPVLNVTTTSSLSAWSSSRLTFGEDYIYFNWQGIHTAGTDYIYATVTQQIPEPTVFILFGLGIFIICLKKKL